MPHIGIPLRERFDRSLTTFVVAVTVFVAVSMMTGCSLGRLTAKDKAPLRLTAKRQRPPPEVSGRQGDVSRDQSPQSPEPFTPPTYIRRAALL